MITSLVDVSGGICVKSGHIVCYEPDLSRPFMKWAIWTQQGWTDLPSGGPYHDLLCNAFQGVGSKSFKGHWRPNGIV
jgi:hypothetical protein